jgi:preprotein translocase subunit SecF
VASGAYSSIFVASPFLCWLKEREPQNRKLAARAQQSTGSAR